ncbi:nucleotidyltransferase domain-containing protein [Cylindrospermum sp. FACHB-282]|uniref:nucleotidyltransferase domain-containing protein n=1 Tax=Cylindrospermum sp. FACHB-282 TaxID=2692794 RepID=UPI001684E972|nr:nucleotidyltransferase family protein [Cylindrospermum sp. FACHB-282]MBD2387131.1 nucleotidyltransferase family protein [Cylindrospermum sp. FACHB-282]
MQTYLKPKPKTTDESMTTFIQPPTKTPAATNPEIELLLCCARTHITTETAESIKTLVQQNINWNYLIETASRHGVIPLLYQSLNTTCSDRVTDNIAQLKNFFHSNAVRNLFLTQELLKLLELFQEHEIPAIPFKGPVLAATAYGNLALRQFGDLDILVHEHDVLKVKNLLVSRGYSSWSVKEADEIRHLQTEGEHLFNRKDCMVAVDLHWRLTRRHLCFPLDSQSLWERLEPLSLTGIVVPNLNFEDLLLFLCVHGTHHGWERLGWICDIAQLVTLYQESDWNSVLSKSRTLGSERILLLGLFLAHDLLGTALPSAISQRVLADPMVTSLAKQVREGLFCETVNSSSISGNSFFYIQARERIQDRVKYFLLSTVPNARDWSFLQLPRSLSFLYYLIRPIRLVSKYGKRLLGQTKS